MQKSLFTVPLALCCVLALSSGCATIFKGDRSALKFVGIDKNFPLEVQMQNGQVLYVERGNDFQAVLLSCKRDHILRLRYRDKEAFVKAQRVVGAGWLALDAGVGVLTGFATAFYLGFVGGLVDVTTGNWHEFHDIPVTANDSMWTVIPAERLRQDSLQYAQLYSFESSTPSASIFPADSAIVNHPFAMLSVDKEPWVDIQELRYNTLYPQVAARGGIQGKVVVRSLIDREGNCVKGIIAYSDSELLNNSALQAVRFSKFTPAVRNGMAVPCWVDVPIMYHIH
ncbi:MAG: energy transducer TonB [Candidatus Kapabacteria bacterium]|nr:energy transducer TonB [Candidatus Kapabacteria bacterium]